MRLIRGFLHSLNWWWALAVLITAPALTLAVLGLGAVRAERIDREQQLRDQQAQLARLADAALAHCLDQLESELRAIDLRAVVRSDESALSDTFVFTFDRRGLLTFDHERIYFGNRTDLATLGVSTPEWSPATEQLIEQAQSAEAQKRGPDAIATYRRIMTAEAKLCPWAEQSIARIQYESGEESALALLSSLDWSNSEGLTPTGLPVALIACVYAEKLPGEKRVRFALLVEQTLKNLRNARWWLSPDERRFYDRELRNLLESAGSTSRWADDARLDELAVIEEIIRGSPPTRRDAPTRSFDRVEHSSSLIINLPSSHDANVWIGVALDGDRVANLLNEVLGPLSSGQSFNSAIRDAQGKVIWGKLPDDSLSSQTVGLHVMSGWEMAFGGATDIRWIDQKRLLWYGFIIVLVVTLVAGLAMTTRVMRREAELSRMQNEFVAAVSHDFNSPIAGIRLLMERLMSGRLRDAQNVSEYYSAIERETRRLERHVNRLLEAQQIQEGRKQYNFTQGSITEIVESAIAEMRPQAAAKQIQIQLKTEGHIAELRLDKAAIAEAIENLLDNAIKYSPANAPVSVSLSLADHDVRVEVCDQGIGIEKDNLPRVFDRFYRARRGDQHDARGTGLGLALVKATVEAHGGTVEVMSEPGKGSRFSLRLPLYNGGQNAGTNSDS